MCELTNGMAGERYGHGMLCVNWPLERRRDGQQGPNLDNDNAVDYGDIMIILSDSRKYVKKTECHKFFLLSVRFSVHCNTLKDDKCNEASGNSQNVSVAAGYCSDG